MVKQPVFLVGAERSGTTLLGLMLDHHPKICWKQEFEYITDLIGEKCQYPNIREFHEWLETNRDFQLANLKIDQGYDYCELVDSFLEQQKPLDTGSICGATVHRNFDKLLCIWTDARFIHIIRDPRDVARSCIQMGWAGNVWYGVDQWLEAEKLWDAVEKNIGIKNFVNVKYEDLVVDPGAVLSRICRFIGIEYSASMMSYDKSTTYSRPDSKLREQWRKKLTSHEIKLVEKKTHDFLLKREYVLSGLEPLAISPSSIALLRLQNKIYTVRYRLKMFGIKLFLSEFFSRKLGMHTWQKRARLQMNQIEITHLK